MKSTEIDVPWTCRCTTVTSQLSYIQVISCLLVIGLNAYDISQIAGQGSQ